MPTKKPSVSGSTWLPICSTTRTQHTAARASSTEIVGSRPDRTGMGAAPI
jgi:hypothetical protein